MSAEPSAQRAAPVHATNGGLLTHAVNIFRLAVKELRSIRADPMMLVLVAYTFSIAVYTVATGASTEAKDLTVGIVDEDRSDLSRRLLDALHPPLFKSSVFIKPDEIDANMNEGRLIFVLEIPPSFQTNLLAGRQTSLQLNVDATAMAQAGTLTEQATLVRRFGEMRRERKMLGPRQLNAPLVRRRLDGVGRVRREPDAQSPALVRPVCRRGQAWFE